MARPGSGPPRDTRTFPTKQDRAVFSVSPIEVLQVPEGGRRVIFLHPETNPLVPLDATPAG